MAKPDKKAQHIHYWVINPLNPTEQICKSVSGFAEDYEDKIPKCYKILVSEEEYDKRMAEWTNYYNLVENTPAYKDYQELRLYAGNKEKKIPVNLEALKKVLDRIHTRGHEAKNEFGDPIWVVDKTELETPHFPDPVNEPWRYIVQNP